MGSPTDQGKAIAGGNTALTVFHQFPAAGKPAGNREPVVDREKATVAPYSGAILAHGGPVGNREPAARDTMNSHEFLDHVLAAQPLGKSQGQVIGVRFRGAVPPSTECRSLPHLDRQRLAQPGPLPLDAPHSPARTPNVDHRRMRITADDRIGKAIHPPPVGMNDDRDRYSRLTCE